MKNTKKQALYSIDDVETDTVDEEEERQKQIRESGSVIAKNRRHTVQCLTIIGQIEGHYIAPSQNKTTKYEHVIPQIVAVEEDPQIDGLLMDMSAEGVAQKVETMGLTAILDQLRAQNNLYRELSRTRRAARSNETMESSAAIRKRMDFYYGEMSTAAFAQSAALPTETNKRFIALLNTLIDETKQKYNLRKGIAESNDKKQEETKPAEGQPDGVVNEAEKGKK